MKYNIDNTVIDSTDKADSKTVLILVCNRSQHASTTIAVEQCLKHVKREDLFERIILIMLHIAREEKLPKLPSTSEVRCIRSNIGGVVDMGFNDGSIYLCNRNDEAFKCITQFIKEQNMIPSTKQNGADPIQNKKRERSIHKRVSMISHLKSNAQESFVDKFRTELHVLGIEVDERESSEASRLDPDLILIVVCNATSRNESDTENAFGEGIGAICNRKVLLMLHVVREGKEPNTFTEKKLVDSKVLNQYQSLLKIIDVAYDNKTKKIFKCNMNDNAFEYFKYLDAKVKCTTENQPGIK